MKILHINSYYFAGKFYKNLYDIEHEHMDIEVYVPIQKKDTVEFEYGKYTTVSKVFNNVDRAFFHIKHKKILKDVIDKYNLNSFDVLHAHSLFSNGYIAYKLKKFYGIPYVVAVRNTDVNVFFKKMLHLRKLGVRILTNADSIVFLSSSYRDKVVEDYVPKKWQAEILNKSHIIPNGIDSFWINNKHFKQLDNKNSLNIITAGEINDNKKQITVCEICEDLIGRGYNVKYKLAGKISNRKLFDTIVQKEYVEYKGILNKEELLAEYRKSDLFILLSKTETFGLVYAEALSQGLPILYTRGEGFDGQFKDGEVGFPINLDNTNGTYKYIEIILQDYDNFSLRAMKGCQKFNWNAIEENYEKLYQMSKKKEGR